jgi:hypothetical protein
LGSLMPISICLETFCTGLGNLVNPKTGHWRK